MNKAKIERLIAQKEKELDYQTLQKQRRIIFEQNVLPYLKSTQVLASLGAIKQGNIRLESQRQEHYDIIKKKFGEQTGEQIINIFDSGNRIKAIKVRLNQLRQIKI